MKFTNRILALLLAIVMVIGLLPMSLIGASAATDTYVETALANIEADDTVILVSINGTATYAMSNDSDKAPAAVAVTIDGTSLTTDATNIQWNIANDNGDLTIYPAGVTDKWLYCTNTNNGVRVGTNTNKVFTMDATTNYLKNTATSRYIGVYNNADWRCYTNTTGNTVGQTFKFYVLQDGVTTPDESIDPSECEHANTTDVAEVPATCTEAGTAASVYCNDCKTTISGGETIAATGHTPGEAATCTAAQTCTVCSAEINPATGHTYVDGICSVCSEAEPAEVTAQLSFAGGSGKNVDPISFADEASGVSVEFTAGTHSTKPRWDATCVRFYGTDSVTNHMTVSCPDGYKIIKIEFAMNGSYALTAVSADSGAIDTATNTWTGSASAVVFTTTAQTRIGGVTVTYEKEGGHDSHATIEKAEVPATCTTDGVKAGVYCETCGEWVSGGDVIPAPGHSLVYGAETITCSACDLNEAYTLTDIATAKGTVADGNTYYVKGIVTFIDSKSYYIQDATGAIVIRLTAVDANLAVGDELLAKGTVTAYNGLLQFENVTDQAYVETGVTGEVAAQIVTLADLAADTTNEYLGEKVDLSGYWITAVGEWDDYHKNVDYYTITDGTNTIVLYRTPAATAEDLLKISDTLDITGAIVSSYNGYQLRIADASQITVTGSHCAHDNAEAEDAKAPSCTTTGHTEGFECPDCGYIEGLEEIAALGHTDENQDYICETCGESLNLAGNYYIAALRGTTYWWLEGAANSTRYNAINSELAALPASIAEGAENLTFTLIAGEAYGTYTMKLAGEGTEDYLGWSSGNSGDFVAADKALVLTVDELANNGGYQIHFTSTSENAERYLSLNGTEYKYWAWYKSGQIKDIYLIPVEAIVACQHTETKLVDAVTPTCTDSGYSGDTRCANCNELITAGETLAATGHTFENDVCTVCGAADVNFSGSYYIAALKETYRYMTDDLGTASTQRYYTVNSELSALPESIENGNPSQVFTLTKVSGSTYTISVDGQYLSWTSGNSGALSDTAMNVTVEKAEDGTFTIHFTGDDERYLCLNTSNGDYFAWYKKSSKQNEALSLIPAVACTAHAFADGICGTCGYKKQHITSASLTLESTLKLNITVDVSDLSDVYTLRAAIGKDDAQALTDNVVAIPAHRLNETVKIELVFKEKVLSSVEWTLDGYVAELQKEENYAQMEPVVNALCTYADYAQAYAKGTDLDAVEATIPAELKQNITVNTNKALKPVASLYLDDACDITVKFDAAAWEGYTLYIDGTAVEVTEGTDQVSYTVAENLLPQNWGTGYVIEVKDAEGNLVFSVTYSAMSYAYAQINRYQGDAKLNNLLKTMYQYYVAAAAYAA